MPTRTHSGSEAEHQRQGAADDIKIRWQHQQNSGDSAVTQEKQTISDVNQTRTQMKMQSNCVRIKLCSVKVTKVHSIKCYIWINYWLSKRVNGNTV